MGYMPGRWKPGRAGQFPSFAGSPPIWTNTPCDGVGPSRMNNWYHPGGETFESGGAVTVQTLFPEHENAGKIVRPPMMLLWVLDVATTSETLMLEVLPWNNRTVIWYRPPYVQYVFGIVTMGCVRPSFRYGGMYTSMRSSWGSGQSLRLACGRQKECCFGMVHLHDCCGI